MGSKAGRASATDQTEAVEAQGARRSSPVGDWRLERIASDFEAAGLNGYEARVLLALVRAGQASPAQLAKAAGVHRTAAYPVLQELETRGLAERIPGQSTLWASPGREEVVERLWSTQEERLRNLQSRLEATREVLAEIAPDVPSSAVPHVQILATAAQARAAYDRLLSEARTEFLVLNRPPYSEGAVKGGRAVRAAANAKARDEVNPEVLAALKRGVSIRVLYESSLWDGFDAEPFRQSMGAYHRAGVQGRVVDTLPMKLVLSDRRAALLALADPVTPDIGFPTNLLIEHGGYCAFQADAFEYRWERADPCPD